MQQHVRPNCQTNSDFSIRRSTCCRRGLRFCQRSSGNAARHGTALRHFATHGATGTGDRTSHSDVPSAVAQFPTIFNTNPTDKLVQVSSPKIVYHTSFWYDNLVRKYTDLPHKLPAGLEDYERALRIWTDAYERSPPQLHAAVMNDENDVFVVALSCLKHTGMFLGVPARGNSSMCLGVHRFALDSNMKVHDVWSFRSGTLEERQLLVKDADQRGDVSPWAPGLTLYGTDMWPADDAIHHSAQHTVSRWLRDVWVEEPNFNALDEILAPDVQIYDGMAIKAPKPHVGAHTFKEHVKKLHQHYEFGGAISLSVAVSTSGNLAFVHWTHCFTHRTSGKMSHVDGITLLTLDHSSRIVQILDFSGLLEEQKPHLLQDRHPALPGLEM